MYFKVFLLFWSGLLTVGVSLYYFLIRPDEVFEIRIDSSIEKLDTIFRPKYKYGSDYTTICIKESIESNDTIMFSNRKYYNEIPYKSKVCQDGVEMGDAHFELHYNRYKASKVLYHVRYEYYR